MRIRKKKPTLKKDSLNVIETIALSVALIAPTAAMALNVSLMSKTASFSSPLIFFISMIIVGLVAYSIIKFNQRLSSAGSLYAFTEKTLGKNMGFTTGWTLILAYTMIAAGSAAALGSFFSKFLAAFGIHTSWLPLALVFSLLLIYVGIKDAKTNTKIMIITEGISVFMILILSVVILYKVGKTTGLSLVPFKTNGNSFSTLATTSVFAFLALTGFESASSLGEETKNPKVIIPLAIGSAVFASSLFYLLSSYAQVIGFGLDANGLKSLSSSTLPLSDLSNKFITKDFGIMLILTASLSFFSCSLGAVLAGARVLFSMSRDGLMPRSMKKIHKISHTPYIGIILIMTIAIILQISLSPLDGIEIFGYLATIGSLSLIVTYLFTCFGAFVYFKKHKSTNSLDIFIPIISVIALIYVLGSNIYPIPAFPSNIFIYIVLAWITVGFIVSHKLRKNKSRNIDIEIKKEA